MLDSRQIVVVRALYLGDLLCAVPALRSLRAGHPHAHITLIGLAWARTLVDRFPAYLDAFEEFPGYPGIPEVPIDQARIAEFLTRMQARRIDLAIQLHGSGTHINAFVALLGARRNAGFYPAGDAVPPEGSFVPWPTSGSEIERLLAVPRALGCPDMGATLELPLTATARARASELVPRHPYVCIHPGARLSSRRWLPRRFASVADTFAARGYAIVLTGSGGEIALTNAVRRSMTNHAVDLAGLTTLDVLAAVIERASILVCNDTGVSHVAAALGTPSVVIASGSDVPRWAPLERDRHEVLWSPVACRPCSYEVCPTAHECAAGVSVDDVVHAAERLA
ncbi:MAG TPA: glycosyltransferase family 9 protein [Gemmatimonadaceae bacterium]|nr:glycosyltransferase family 9 protein [Gemmatimonadaceae bacterium]